MIHLKNCPVCGSKNIIHYIDTKDFFYSHDNFSLFKCNSCQLIFTNPYPEETNLSEYYKTEKYLSHNTQSINPITFLYKVVRKINIREKYAIVESFKKEGNIIDIGCGTGELLNWFKKNNWKTIGVEPNDHARSIAQNIYHLDVKNIDYLKKKTSKRFEVITMWHVLEHVPNVKERINSIKNLLADDGIVIIAVPNIVSFDALFYKEYWAGLDVPRHLYHFSSQSLKTLFEQFNMKIIREIPMKYDAFYVSWLSEKYKNNNFPLIRGILKGIKFNRKAKRNGEYSSKIYIIKLNK